MGCCCTTTCVGILAAFFLILPRIGARLCPRVWFGFTALIFLSALNILSFFAYHLTYLSVSRKTTNSICCWLAGRIWGLWLWVNPQIRIEENGFELKWEEIPKGAYILVNHMSFLDCLVVAMKMPTVILGNCKSMYKSSLAKLPILGPIFARCGHFPVYFKGTDLNDYSVDKEKQMKVNEGMDKFMESKEGYMIMCPEGAMNPEPFRLLPFRHGSFQLAVKCKSPMYGCVLVGCADAWPRTASIGGNASHIKLRLVKFDINYDDPEISAGMVADSCRLQMQKKLDALIVS